VTIVNNLNFGRQWRQELSWSGSHDDPVYGRAHDFDDALQERSPAEVQPFFGAAHAPAHAAAQYDSTKTQGHRESACILRGAAPNPNILSFPYGAHVRPLPKN
jgi:hypothetical protein